MKRLVFLAIIAFLAPGFFYEVLPEQCSTQGKICYDDETQNHPNPFFNWHYTGSSDSSYPIVGSTLFYNPRDARIYKFGGAWRVGSGTALQFANTFYYWNSGWSDPNPSGRPGARAFASSAYDFDQQQIVLFGGFDGSLRSDFWRFKDNSWNQISINWNGYAPIGARYEAVMYYQSGKLYVVGGRNNLNPVPDNVGESLSPPQVANLDDVYVFQWDGGFSEYRCISTGVLSSKMSSSALVNIPSVSAANGVLFPFFNGANPYLNDFRIRLFDLASFDISQVYALLDPLTAPQPAVDEAYINKTLFAYDTHNDQVLFLTGSKLPTVPVCDFSQFVATGAGGNCNTTTQFWMFKNRSYVNDGFKGWRQFYPTFDDQEVRDLQFAQLVYNENQNFFLLHVPLYSKKHPAAGARNVIYVSRDTVRPTIPVLLLPSEGAPLGMRDVSFSWKASTEYVSGPLTYEIKICQSLNGDGTDCDYNDFYLTDRVSGTNYQIDSSSVQVPFGTLYWRIWADDGVTYPQKAATSFRSFSVTLPDYPTSPTGFETEPALNSDAYDLSPRFRLSGAQHADHFTLRVMNINAFSCSDAANVVRESGELSYVSGQWYNTAGDVFSPLPPSAGTTFYWFCVLVHNQNHEPPFDSQWYGDPWDYATDYGVWGNYKLVAGLPPQVVQQSIQAQFPTDLPSKVDGNALPRLSWTVADDSAITQFVILSPYLAGNVTCGVSGNEVAINKAAATKSGTGPYTFTYQLRSGEGLAYSSSYTGYHRFCIKTRNANGDSSYVIMDPPGYFADFTPPTQPSNLQVAPAMSPIRSSGVTFGWNASTDAESGIKEYVLRIKEGVLTSCTSGAGVHEVTVSSVSQLLDIKSAFPEITTWFASHTFSWCVTAVDNRYNATVSSAPYPQFIVELLATNPTSLETNPDTQAGASANSRPLVYWRGAQNAYYYDFKVLERGQTTCSSGTALQSKFNTTDTNHTLGAPLPDAGSYTFCVQAKTASGYAAVGWKQLTYRYDPSGQGQPPPGKPRLMNKLIQKKNTCHEVSLLWTPVDARAYELYYDTQDTVLTTVDANSLQVQNGYLVFVVVIGDSSCPNALISTVADQYKFWVAGVEGATNVGELSNSVTAKMMEADDYSIRVSPATAGLNELDSELRWAVFAHPKLFGGLVRTCSDIRDGYFGTGALAAIKHSSDWVKVPDNPDDRGSWPKVSAGEVRLFPLKPNTEYCLFIKGSNNDVPFVIEPPATIADVESPDFKGILFGNPLEDGTSYSLTWEAPANEHYPGGVTYEVFKIPAKEAGECALEAFGIDARDTKPATSVIGNTEGVLRDLVSDQGYCFYTRAWDFAKNRDSNKKIFFGVTQANMAIFFDTAKNRYTINPPRRLSEAPLKMEVTFGIYHRFAAQAVTVEMDNSNPDTPAFQFKTKEMSQFFTVDRKDYELEGGQIQISNPEAALSFNRIVWNTAPYFSFAVRDGDVLVKLRVRDSNGRISEVVSPVTVTANSVEGGGAIGTVNVSSGPGCGVIRSKSNRLSTPAVWGFAGMMLPLLVLAFARFWRRKELP